MASMRLLSSRLQALVQYGKWTESEVTDLFIALAKRHKDKTDHEFVVQMLKTLYQIEIHKIAKSELSIQSVENIDAQVNKIVKESKEKTLEEILREIREQENVDEKILKDVEDIVSHVDSWSRSNPRSLPTLTEKQWKDDKKLALCKLCEAVKNTTKWFPRLTQMVSWCILVLSGSSRLVQVGTGEGKSCIVAMFAAYSAITGGSVDIISSSPVLAERDSQEWRSFYQKLKVTVDVNSNKQKTKDLRKCYECQVVYGTTDCFAGDWLRHHFHRQNIMPGRKFQRVIADEVDSLMLDKGLQVVYLNTEMPTMQALTLILAEIWFVVNQLEHLDNGKTLGLVQPFSQLLSENLGADADLDELAGIVSVLQPDKDESSIPGFLKHINSKQQTWIENAIHAKSMTLGDEYVLHADGVVPVDYRSTGVVQNNMKWGDGLQQFLEMKHQTRLTDMNVITNFKSNIRLFKSYKSQVYGVTGTLGNQAELDMLQKLYPGMKTCNIPSFKKRKLYEKKGMVVTEEAEWIQTICAEVTDQLRSTVYRGARAALVICETINRAETIYTALQETIPMVKLKLYTNNNMDNSWVTSSKVEEGWVIIATNLAGRGTDLKICDEVNEAGGLFVVQTFLPLNVRVEQQAFGRTARQGSPGSAQLIMCSSHFSESLKCVMVLQTSPLFMILRCLSQINSTLGILDSVENEFVDALKAYRANPDNQTCEAVVRTTLVHLLVIEDSVGPTTLTKAKQARDTVVQIRLSGFLEKDIPKLNKKEELFSEYLKMLNRIYNQDQFANNREDIVSSLHECWGMWLLVKFDEDKPTESLQLQLKQDMEGALGNLKSNQSPSSMVYYYIRSGNRLRHQGRLAESIEMYTRATEDPCWGAIAFYNRAISTLAQKGNGYVARALADLEKAGKAVDSCMQQLNHIFTYVRISSKDPNRDDSLLQKQFKAKYLVQELLKANIEEAVKSLREAEDRGREVRTTEKHLLFLRLEFIILTRVSPMETARELHNLYSLGLDTVVSIDTGFSFAGLLTRLLRS
ncbi:protein translocase subunit SecA-like [Astyanax mexicanus]|uniref:Protein translocase subunit SecA-like n=1 Tax=Astyanax mexicanus TaxID=7994 RepID=A0A8T2KK05_ASTMX|nr:protein translocase subunit SecA-like [Astyanax mexicanus]